MVNKITNPPSQKDLIDKVNELVDDKQDTLVSGTNIKTINNTSILGSGNIDIQGGGGSYTAGTGIDINNDVISVTNDISAGAALGATALQSGDNISELVNNSGYITSSALSGYATQVWVGQQGYITGITSSDVTTALGYTPYNSTNPNGYITSSALTPYALSVDLASVATSGSYNDLSNKPTIPTVNNPTITFTQGGTTKGTITLNQSTNQTVAFDAGGSARNIGQIIQSTIPLTDAGLHLLDGALIQGNGIYSEFVDYMVQKSKKFNPTPFNLNQYTSVNSEGITSELTYNTRCTVNINNITPTNKIVFNFSGKLQRAIFSYVRLSNTISIYHTGVGNTLVIAYNYDPILSITEDEIPTYNSNFTDIKIELTTTKIIATIKNNSNTFTKEADINITFSQISVLNIPGNDGKVIANLKNCSLIIDDTEIFSGSTQQDYFTDETSWQNSVNTYGVCGKFVYDSVNNTIRLPKISGFIEGTNDYNALGVLTQAGLPNITGQVRYGNSGDIGVNTQYVSGAFYADTGTNKKSASSGSQTNNHPLLLDASRSSSIYGRSNTVQPQSIKVLYYIVIATSTKTDIQVDIDEIATDLNGKADTDLSNCTKPHIVETYVNGSSWYRVYSDGWCEQGGRATISSYYANITFLKQFVDTNYNIGFAQNGVSEDTYCANVKNFTNSTMQLRFRGGGTFCFWQACGYI